MVIGVWVSTNRADKAQRRLPECICQLIKLNSWPFATKPPRQLSGSKGYRSICKSQTLIVPSRFKYTQSIALTLDNHRPASRVIAHNSLTMITIHIKLIRRIRHEPDQAKDKRHDQHQQSSINVERNLWRDSPGVKTVRNRLSCRLKSAERATTTRRLFDVGGEGSKDPVELQLSPVAGYEDD